MNITKEHTPRKYSSFAHSGGVVLCDKKEGAFLVLRFESDLTLLKELLSKITTLGGESQE